MTDLHGKIALITGAARGRGAAEARMFAERGAKVVLTDLLVEDGERTASRRGRRIGGFPRLGRVELHLRGPST